MPSVSNVKCMGFTLYRGHRKNNAGDFLDAAEQRYHFDQTFGFNRITSIVLITWKSFQAYHFDVTAGKEAMTPTMERLLIEHK